MGARFARKGTTRMSSTTEPSAPHNGIEQLEAARKGVLKGVGLRVFATFADGDAANNAAAAIPASAAAPP